MPPLFPKGFDQGHACAFEVTYVAGGDGKTVLDRGRGNQEISEVLLQAAIYCGVPAANSAFKQAREVFAQMEREE